MTLKELIHITGFEPRGYSISGFGGRQCLAFVTEQEPARCLVDLTIAIYAKADEGDRVPLLEQIKRAHISSLGFDTVITFPRIVWK